MTPDEIRELVSRREGTNLDFKLTQYDWANEGNYELAKDLMAMANKLGPFAAPAYILVGVKEVEPEKTGDIVGLDRSLHLDDADMQAKVKRLINRQPNFSYSAVEVDGLSVGVFRIFPGRRPYYALKDCGSIHRLFRFQVLHRLSTGTDVASGDEIVAWSREDDPMDQKVKALQAEELESKLAIHARIDAPGTTNSGDIATYRFDVSNDGVAPFRIIGARLRWKVDEVRLREWITSKGGRLISPPDDLIDTNISFARNALHTKDGTRVESSMPGAVLNRRFAETAETQFEQQPPPYATFTVGQLELDLQGNVEERKKTVKSTEFPWRK